MDDPRIPELGTEEGRKRLRDSGVPLDEWVRADWDSPEAKAKLAEERRRYARKERIAYWAIGLAILGGVLWSATTAPDEPTHLDRYDVDVGVPR